MQDQGRFIAALEELRHGDAQGTKVPGWPHPSAAWVRKCERLIELDGLLPPVLRGENEPATPAERLDLADLCQLPCKRRYAAAARFYADAFAADQKFAADLQRQHRYNAACSASLAAAGQGADAKHLPDKVRQMLRRQALAWLRADMALYAGLAGREEPPVKQTVRQRLGHWQQDTDLASVRDADAISQLPEGEAKQWRQLWEDVAALLKKVGEKK